MNKKVRVSGRIGAGCSSDRGLVDFNHLVYLFRARHGLILSDTIRGFPDAVMKCFEQNIMDERALARPRYARHANKKPERKSNVELLQIMFGGSADHKFFGGTGIFTVLGNLYPLFSGQIL